MIYRYLTQQIREANKDLDQIDTNNQPSEDDIGDLNDLREAAHDLVTKLNHIIDGD
jgi:hypothetical protein